MTRDDADQNVTEEIRPGGRRRAIALGGWIVALVVWSLILGLPFTDPLLAFCWMWAAVMAWNSHKSWREQLGFVRDWLPVIGVLIAYNVSRGFADANATPHAFELIWADRILFNGALPTLALQHAFYDENQIHWWDVAASFIYFSHFVVAYIVALALWLHNRTEWLAFMRRWIGLWVAGLATYFLYPAAPQGWAAKYGLIEPVARISSRGWQAIGLHSAGSLLNKAQGLSNPIAAMPSIHSATSLLVVAFFFRRVPARWLPLLFLYPISMMLTLVYTGDHYVIDALVGFTYVGIIFALAAWWERRKRRQDHPIEPATSTDSLVGSEATAQA